MRRVAVIGPNPPCGTLNADRFVEMLSHRIGLEAFSLRPLPGLALAPGGDAPLPVTGRYDGSVMQVDADTLILLRFSARAYLRDWVAGWLDVLLNGGKGMRRRAHRARLVDVMRACLASLQRRTAENARLENLRPQVLLVELSSPEQALFWLEMQEERVREETIPPA